MPKVEKVLVYWEGDKSPYVMNRKEFMDQVQGTFLAVYDPTVDDFKSYFADKWENGEVHE